MDVYKGSGRILYSIRVKGFRVFKEFLFFFISSFWKFVYNFEAEMLRFRVSVGWLDVYTMSLAGHISKPALTLLRFMMQPTGRKSFILSWELDFCWLQVKQLFAKGKGRGESRDELKPGFI